MRTGRGNGGLSGRMEQLMRYGRYQAFYTAVAFVHLAQEWSNVALLMLAGQRPLVQCVDGNGTYSAVMEAALACGRMANGTCDEYELHYEFHSWTIEWRLFCGRWRMFNDAGTIQMAGVFVGNLCFGQLSDAIGRKKAYMVAWLPLTIVGLGSAAVHSPTVYLWTRLAAGFFVGGLSTVSYTYLSEVTTSRSRLHVRLALTVPTVEVLLIVPAAYVLGDWRALSVAMNALAAPALAAFALFAHESPLWLVRRGDVDAAVTVLHSVCNRWNGHSPRLSKAQLRELVDCQLLRADNDQSASAPGVASRRYYIWHLFCTPTLARRTAALAYCWFTVSLTSYGIVLGVGELAGSVYANIVYMALLRWAVTLLLVVADATFKRFGRRTLHVCTVAPMAACLAAAALCHVLAAPWSAGGVRALSIAARGLTAGAWTAVYLMSVEMYATGVRNAANSFGSMCARVGAALSPQVLLLSSPSSLNVPSAASWLYAIMAAGEAAVFAAALPETKGAPLPDRMPPQRLWFKLCRAEEEESEHGEGNGERMESADGWDRADSDRDVDSDADDGSMLASRVRV